jgi:hypothetical protein
MSEDIGSLIDQARKAGHSDKQIYEHLSTSVNPEYQKFARKNAQQFGVTAPPPTVENIASDAWDLANQPFGATGITPLKVAEASLVPATGYAAYKYAKSQNAKPETPALSDEDLVHQRLIKQEELRSLKLNNDLLERKLNPIAQPAPTVQPVAQPAQPIVPTQAPAAPSFGKGTDMPLNPFTTDIQKIAQVTNPTTAAMAEVATGKPAVPPVDHFTMQASVGDKLTSEVAKLQSAVDSGQLSTVEWQNARNKLANEFLDDVSSKFGDKVAADNLFKSFGINRNSKVLFVKLDDFHDRFLTAMDAGPNAQNMKALAEQIAASHSPKDGAAYILNGKPSIEAVNASKNLLSSYANTLGYDTNIPNELIGISKPEVATGKPAVPPPTRDKLVGPAPEFIGPVKPPEVTDKFKGLKSEYKSVDQIPAGFEFKPGVHVSNMDNFLHSVMGPEHRLYAKELINSGQMFPEVKGTGFNTEASKLSRAYQGALQSQIPESLSPLKSSFGKLGKAAKVGGVAGTLFALGEAANAAQKGNFGEAAVRGADIATDYIPGVAQIKSGLTPMGLSSTEQEELAYRRRLEEAQKKGAANRGKAYDPRKFYSPMDIGVPPP